MREAFGLSIGHIKNNKKTRRQCVFWFEFTRLKNEEGINTPKVGIYIHGFNNNYQDSIDELFDLEKT